MNARSDDAGKIDPRIHKAQQSQAGGNRCQICGQRIHAVPGGQGATFVHSDSGAVVAHDPPLPVAELIAERDTLRAQNAELVRALRDMLTAYAPHAQETVDAFNGDESILHSAVRYARTALAKVQKESQPC